MYTEEDKGHRIEFFKTACKYIPSCRSTDSVK